MKILHKHLLSVLLVAAVAVPAAAHAAGERRANLRAQREMDAMSSVVGAVNLTAGSERKVTLNGAPLFFRKTSERGTLDAVMARVAKECASGAEASAFGLSKRLDDGANEPIELQRVFSQESEGVRASLCIFANAAGARAPNEELHRVRYTLAHAREDGSIAVTTVVNASSTPLNELFPAEGDAPGSDLEGVARPEQSRRTMTAIVGSPAEHAVRVYESTLALEPAVASYDRQMSALGYVTTGSLEDARMYRKDGRSYVASFRGTTDGSTVALLPFGSPSSH